MAKLPRSDPRTPAPYTNAELGSLQAMAKGEAEPHVQQRALKYIVETICGTYDLSYRENDRDTAFAEGKRFVGLQIVKLTKLNIAALRESDG